MDNVLSNIIEACAKLKSLGIKVDTSNIEERIKVYLLDKLGAIFPKISKEENVELTFNVKVSNLNEPQLEIHDVSFSINEKKEPKAYVAEYDSDNTDTKEHIVSEPETVTEQITASNRIKLSGSFGHKKLSGNNEINIEPNINDGTQHISSSKDSSKFSLNGSEFLPKRVFAQRIVKTFVEQHPNYTYEQLKEVFNDDIIRPAWVCKGLIARVDDLLDGTISEKEINVRYNFSNTELCLKSADGIEFFVSTQWMREAIDKLIVVAERYGMHCEISDTNLKSNKTKYPKKQQLNRRLIINYIIVNGILIPKSNVSEMFVKFVEIVGAENIFRLKIPIYGGFLVDNKIIEKYESSCKPVGNGFYLFTNTPTEKKIKQMKDIAERLNIKVIINTDKNV